MTFKNAYKELKKLANGRYHCIDFELTTYSNGDRETRCGVYIDQTEWFFRTTWKDALEALRAHLAYNPKAMEEIPDVCDKEGRMKPC